MKAFVVCVLALAYLATSTQLTKETAGKVKVDFYYESLCPYCQQYILKSLKLAASTKDFWKICDFSLFPYGNARRTRNGTSWSFNCQHGTRECEGNFIETCAIKKFDFYAQSVPFIICLEEGSSDWKTTGQKCASQLNMNWTLIEECATSREGVKYEIEMAEATQSLNPSHQYVPWIVVNDVHSASYEAAIINDMVKFVCSIYSGSQKIDACS